jgi:hypothetical protein
MSMPIIYSEAYTPIFFTCAQWHSFAYTEADFILGWEHLLAATADLVCLSLGMMSG